MKKPITDEEGVIVYNRKPVHPVRGKVTLDGAPAAKTQLVFWLPDPKDGKKGTRVTDALVEADGSYSVSSYVANDGLPEGDYKITATLRDPFFEPAGKLGTNLLPEKYATYATTPFEVKVKAGMNTVDLKLAK